MTIRSDTRSALELVAGKGESASHWEMTAEAFADVSSALSPDPPIDRTWLDLQVDIIPEGPPWRLRTRSGKAIEQGDIFRIIGPGRYLGSDELRKAGIGSAGDNVQVHETAILADAGKIFLGSNVRIDAHCILSGSITLGHHIHLAAGVGIYGSHGVEMSDFSGLSSGVKVYSASDDYSGKSLTNPTIPKHLLKIHGGKISFGRHSIVGAGSIILPGVQIGEGVAVGALSLVSKSLEPWGIYSGVPAKRIKARSQRLLEDEGLVTSR